MTHTHLYQQAQWGTQQQPQALKEVLPKQWEELESRMKRPTGPGDRGVSGSVQLHFALVEKQIELENAYKGTIHNVGK